METNKIEFTGTIERLKSINTKTGTTMVTLLLKVGQDRFKVVAFKNVAKEILKCSDGDQISVVGSGSINSWKDKDDHWHNDFQLSVWEVEVDGQITEYEKNSTGSRTTNPKADCQPIPDQRSDFDYSGGPF